jgi:hypothetical protein
LSGLDAAFKLLGGFLTVRHRRAAEPREAVGLARDIFGDAVVDDLRRLHRDVRWHRVVALRRRRHHQLEIDAHGVEVLEPEVVAGDARADVGFLHLVERARLRRRVQHHRVLHRIEMRLDEFRRCRHRDMGVDVDGDALRPRLAARLAVLARGSRFVLIPLGHRAFRIGLRVFDLAGAALFGGMIGSSMKACRLPPKCSVVTPEKIAGGRSRGSSAGTARSRSARS